MAMTASPWEPPGRVEYVRGLIARDDPEATAREVLDGQRHDGVHEGLGVVAELRAAPLAHRRGVARACVAQLGAASASPSEVERGRVVLAAVSRGFVQEPWLRVWESMLDAWAREYWSMCIADELWTVADAVLDAGARIEPAAVGLLRRSALGGCYEIISS